MVPVLAASGLSVSWWGTAFPLLLLVVTPIAVAIGVIRQRRRRGRTGGPAAVWINVALVIARVGLVSMVLLGGTLVVKPSRSSVDDSARYSLERGWWDYEADPSVYHRTQRLTVRLFDAELDLCPTRMAPVPGKGEPFEQEVERNCWARRRLAADWGDGVSVGKSSLERTIVSPPARVGRIEYALSLVAVVLLVLVFLAVERILTLAGKRRPFSRPVIWWFRLIVASVAGLVLLVPALENRFADSLVREYFGPAGAGHLDRGASIPFAAWAAVIMLLAIGEIWWFGIRLQEDAEATV